MEKKPIRTALERNKGKGVTVYLGGGVQIAGQITTVNGADGYCVIDTARSLVTVMMDEVVAVAENPPNS